MTKPKTLDQKRAVSHDLGTSCEAVPCALLVRFEEFRDKSLGCIPVILCGYSGDGKTVQDRCAAAGGLNTADCVSQAVARVSAEGNDGLACEIAAFQECVDRHGHIAVPNGIT